MKLHIKNMVCRRCVLVVREQLEKMGLSAQSVALGEAEVEGDAIDLTKIDALLKTYGFELIPDHSQLICEQIKTLLIEYVNLLENQDGVLKNSVFLAKKLDLNYQYVSKLFSRTEGITIEQYFIRLKIEKVCEWLSYGEYSLSEIAFKLKYSSVHALSNQFKKITGLTVQQFKETLPARKGLDELNG